MEKSITSLQQNRNRRTAVAALLITLLLLIMPGSLITGLMQVLEPLLSGLRQWVSGWWPGPSPEASRGTLQIDKLVHFLMFAICGVLTARAWIRRPAWALPVFGLIVFGALTELVQYLIPGRSMSFGDFLADSAGALAGFLLWYAFSGRKRLGLFQFASREKIDKPVE